jgi:hypothetical protein
MQALKDQNKKLNKALMKTAEKTLQKWMSRSVAASLNWSFLTWKGASEDICRARKR